MLSHPNHAPSGYKLKERKIFQHWAQNRKLFQKRTAAMYKETHGNRTERRSEAYVWLSQHIKPFLEARLESNRKKNVESKFLSKSSKEAAAQTPRTEGTFGIKWKLSASLCSSLQLYGSVTERSLPIAIPCPWRSFSRTTEAEKGRTESQKC